MTKISTLIGKVVLTVIVVAVLSGLPIIYFVLVGGGKQDVTATIIGFVAMVLVPVAIMLLFAWSLFSKRRPKK